MVLAPEHDRFDASALLEWLVFVVVVIWCIVTLVVI